MKKLSESVWGDIRKRSEGQTERKEDIRNSNVKEMTPIDVGLSVLWADRDLEIDGENKFLIDDVKDYEPNGWRRPTKEEADELLTDANWQTNQKDLRAFRDYTIFIDHGKKSLIFNCEFSKYSEYWLSDNGEQDGFWSTFDFRSENQGAFFPHSVHSMAKLTDKCRVRFVRDKV